jgi:hypothetical protein
VVVVQVGDQHCIDATELAGDAPRAAPDRADAVAEHGIREQPLPVGFEEHRRVADPLHAGHLRAGLPWAGVVLLDSRMPPVSMGPRPVRPRSGADA